MKAISIIQPWASRIIVGGKTIETRTHARLRPAVGHRIAIHASGKRSAAIDTDVIRLQSRQVAMGIHWDYFFGAVLGTVFAIELRELTQADEEAAQCEIDDNRWGLIVRDPIVFPRPIPAKGRLGVWEWTPPEGFKEGNDHA